MEWFENTPWLVGIYFLMCFLAWLVAESLVRLVCREPLAFWRASHWTGKGWRKKDSVKANAVKGKIVGRMFLALTLHLVVLFVTTMCFFSMTVKFDWADGYIIKRPWSEVYKDREIKKRESDEVPSGLQDSKSAESAVVDLEMDGEPSAYEWGCCGGLTAEEIDELQNELEMAWENPESASPEVLAKLPPKDAVEVAREALSDSEVADDDFPVDWNQTIFDAIDMMPDGLEKSMIAVAVVEANRYMANMTPDEERELEADFEKKWARELERNPDLPTEGVEGEALRRTFKIGLAFSKSRLRAEMEELDKRFPIPTPEVSENDISLEEYRGQYLKK